MNGRLIVHEDMSLKTFYARNRHYSRGVKLKYTVGQIKKLVQVEGRTGSMFIAKLIEMNLLHILNLELTKLKLLPIKTTLNIK